jgi:D-alanine-D-alanine ligase
MHIGLTYDLRQEYLAAGYSEDETAEFDRPDTIEALEQALGQLGHTTDRIGHVRQLAARLAAGDRWDLVFNICEGLYGPAREAQVPALLDAYGIPYTFSDPLCMALSLHKGLTKVVARAAGVPTPDFAVVERLDDLDALSLRYPLFAKPVAEGTGKGVTPASRAQDAVSLREVCGRLLERYRQPVLVEEFVPGREFTVGLLGSGPKARVLGTLEVILRPAAEPGVYSYHNKEYCEELVEYPLVSAAEDEEVRQAEAVALKAWQALSCRDAGRVDLRSDAEGRPHFLEVNPLAGLHPAHSDLPMLCTALGMPYVELIEHIVRSAAERIQPAQEPRPRLAV